MSDVTFACPTCSQHISCDESYRGDAVTCPACQNQVSVPRDVPLVAAVSDVKASTAQTLRHSEQKDSRLVSGLKWGLLYGPGLSLIYLLLLWFFFSEVKSDQTSLRQGGYLLLHVIHIFDPSLTPYEIGQHPFRVWTSTPFGPPFMLFGFAVGMVVGLFVRTNKGRGLD